MSQSRSRALLALSLGLALSACKPAPSTPQAGADPAVPTPAVTEASAAAPGAAVGTQCPHPDFNTFLTHFGNDIAVQEKSVADPLISESLDASAQPEPAKVTKQVALADVEWPVIPDPATLSGQGRELQVTPQADGSVQVRIRKPDSSDQQTYTFAQKPCWQLQRVVDDSI